MTDRRGGRQRRRKDDRRRSRSGGGAPPGMHLGEVTIERISHDGRGIATWQGKTLFVENALPEETVQARLIKEFGRYAEAVATDTLIAAPERQEPPCPYYRDCGGCQLQHMHPARQLEFKQEALLEQMERWGGMVPQHLLPPITSVDSGYRSRARMGVWYEKDGSVTLGFRQRQSRELTQIDHCLVLVPELNRLLVPLRQWLVGLATSRAVTHIELMADSDGPAAVVRHIRALPASERTALADLAHEQGCRIWLQGGEGGSLTDIAGQNCDPRLHYQLDDGHLRLGFHPQDFTQVNPLINEQMVGQALSLLQVDSSARVLDLFCGMGNFTLPLARRCAEVIGIEGSPSMVARGQENAARNGIANARFAAADLNAISLRGLRRLCGEISAVVLDPPRDGAKELVPHLRQLSARRLVYVSCNPATLARDAGLLADSGYRLHSLGVLDMFPHTAHVESMALFMLE